LVKQVVHTGVEKVPCGGAHPQIRADQNNHSLNLNLMEVGWLRTHIMVMPMSTLFLPIIFGPSFPQAGAIFSVPKSFLYRCASLSGSD
jgi:hypothetical protein